MHLCHSQASIHHIASCHNSFNSDPHRFCFPLCSWGNMQGMLAASATLTPFTAAQSSAYSPLPVHSRSLLHTSRHIFQGSHLISTIAKSRGCRQAQRCRVLTRSVLDVNEDTWEEEVLKVRICMKDDRDVASHPSVAIFHVATITDGYTG